MISIFIRVPRWPGADEGLSAGKALDRVIHRGILVLGRDPWSPPSLQPLKGTNMLDFLSNTYVMIGMVVVVLGLVAVLFLSKKGNG